MSANLKKKLTILGLRKALSKSSDHDRFLLAIEQILQNSMIHEYIKRNVILFLRLCDCHNPTTKKKRF